MTSFADHDCSCESSLRPCDGLLDWCRALYWLMSSSWSAGAKVSCNTMSRPGFYISIIWTHLTLTCGHWALITGIRANKTKYFRPRLNNEVSSEFSEKEHALRGNWDKSWRIWPRNMKMEALDKLRRENEGTKIRTFWAPFAAKMIIVDPWVCYIHIPSQPHLSIPFMAVMSN